MLINPQRLKFQLKVIGQRFIQERFTMTAAALTLTTLLAIVPLMTVLLTIFSGFHFFHQLTGQIQDFIFNNFVPATGKVVQDYLQNFVSKTQQLSLTGVLFLVATAILLLITIERAINDVWHIRRTHIGLSAWLRYWAMLTLIPLLLAVSLTISSYIFSLPIIKDTAYTEGIAHILLSIAPFICTLLGLTVLYIIVPNCRVPWHAGFIGALTGAVLFEVAKRGFLLYITRISAYHLLYGTLSSIPIFIIWVYVSWVIVLVGALVSNIVGTRFAGQTKDNIAPFSQAWLCLFHLWQAQCQGRSLTLAELSRRIPPSRQYPIMAQLQQLQYYNLISMSEDGYYMIKQELSQLTVRDLHCLLPWKLQFDECCLESNDWLRANYQQHLEQEKQLWTYTLAQYFEHYQSTTTNAQTKNQAE